MGQAAGLLYLGLREAVCVPDKEYEKILVLTFIAPAEVSMDNHLNT